MQELVQDAAVMKPWRSSPPRLWTIPLSNIDPDMRIHSQNTRALPFFVEDISGSAWRGALFFVEDGGVDDRRIYQSARAQGDPLVGPGARSSRRRSPR